MPTFFHSWEDTALSRRSGSSKTDRLVTKTYRWIAGRLYGYVRTSKRHEEGRAGSDLESQQMQLLGAGLAAAIGLTWRKRNADFL